MTLERLQSKPPVEAAVIFHAAPAHWPHPLCSASGARACPLRPLPPVTGQLSASQPHALPLHISVTDSLTHREWV